MASASKLAPETNLTSAGAGAGTSSFPTHNASEARHAGKRASHAVLKLQLVLCLHTARSVLECRHAAVSATGACLRM